MTIHHTHKGISNITVIIFDKHMDIQLLHIMDTLHKGDHYQKYQLVGIHLCIR